MKDFKWMTSVTTYPTGETHARWQRLPKEGDWIFCPHVRTWTDLMTILTLDEAMYRLEGYGPTWFIPYFPFARDDRRRTHYDADTLFHAIDVLDRMRDRIVIADPHSYATEIFKHIPQSEVVKEFLHRRDMFTGHPLICIPDEGAAKKAHSWINDVPNSGVIQGKKFRDPQTGKLSGFGLELTGDLIWGNLVGATVTIIDDICDGGGTFLGLANQLFESGVQNIRFGVTHGLFTNADNLRWMRENFEIVTCMSEDPVLIELNPCRWTDAENMVTQ